MKITNKSINLIPLALVGIILIGTSCSKEFLDVPPQGEQVAEQFFRNQDDVTKAVTSCYAYLRSWNQVAFSSLAVESMGSDDAEKGSDIGDATFMNDYDNFTVTSSQGQLQGFWEGQYQEINLCNQVLSRIDTINMDATLKTRYVGECKFIRAYIYFRLVRAFGDVPLRLRIPASAADYNIPRTPKAQVWAAIEQDLTDAATVLPQSYGAADIGRATKGAALALHAKVAMYQTLATPGRWQDVLNYTNQVIALGYALYPSFEAGFRIPNENNSESVFEIQSQRLPNIAGATNSQFYEVQGVRAAGINWGGWGFNVPTADLASSFEANDPRRDASILFRGETTPQGDVVPVGATNPMYNQKSYVPSSYQVSGFTIGADQNIRVLRFSDVLLMNAEAANELNNTTLALQSLEKVRARARTGAPTGTLPAVTTTDKATLRSAIWRERRAETSMEYDRYFDVIRQGRGTAVFGTKGWKANKNEVWPIPQNEIDLSAGVLTQNPGY